LWKGKYNLWISNLCNSQNCYFLQYFNIFVHINVMNCKP
jgi:hypothetical protein